MTNKRFQVEFPFVIVRTAKERRKSMCEDLLDYVAKKCSLYVSDLRIPENEEMILSIVMNIDCNQFSADDWSKSLSYIFMKPVYFSASTTAKEYYIQRLKNGLSRSGEEQTTC